MTEWDAGQYSKVSALQKWLAQECLAAVELTGSERVLDMGCGDGAITAAIAQRLPHGSIVGIDASAHMIDFARAHFTGATHPNLQYDVVDVCRLAYRDEFDLVVSFNALHWVADQRAALQHIHAALKKSGRTLLQFVARGERKPLEDVTEETRQSPRWADSFSDYHAPYVHVTADAYRALAVQQGFRVERIDTLQRAWDFHTRDAFVEFGQATFVEWTRRLPPADQRAFINDVLDRYRRIGDGSPADANVFHFYQMRVVLRRRDA